MNQIDFFPAPTSDLHKSINNTKLSFMSAPGFDLRLENEALPRLQQLSGKKALTGNNFD